MLVVMNASSNTVAVLLLVDIVVPVVGIGGLTSTEVASLMRLPPK